MSQWLTVSLVILLLINLVIVGILPASLFLNVPRRAVVEMVSQEFFADCFVALRLRCRDDPGELLDPFFVIRTSDSDRLGVSPSPPLARQSPDRAAYFSTPRRALYPCSRGDRA